ncbi:glycosyltransferase family 87 protein [Aquisalinus flavus]|uniref:DUF2029 domain-containing protein n=1 Tax=Aquisalinus flavus TaxID=1526572 RepID=A0A8J2V3Y6_9PROT|nr:glycosyltransferase family 87 protein [Aquisalinus flavus]MBD0425305.1 DUF2029 domain-containing protein [Aquisalinus flavus]UNE49042.1 DUF2029 domain-containing protein [Aquisalinus flavus]GGD17130.1 hypothetical protein GCM10011342_27390 [Aquisalinus flavus]
MSQPDTSLTDRLWALTSDAGRLRRVSIVLALLFAAILAADTLLADGSVNMRGEHLGGDFLAFHTAGEMVLEGRAVDAWDAARFEAALQEREPAIEWYGLTWQYPPAAYFLVTPFALLPYKVAYWAWMLAGLAVFWGCFRAAFGDRIEGKAAPLLILASPIILVTLVQGQNTLFFGGMLMIAAALPGRRPVLAGLAAAVLTIKPQLGLLIPVAYLFGGHWKAFGCAATFSLALSGLATLAFGIESWSAFAGAVSRVEADMAGGGSLYPFNRIISPYGALGALGVPHGIALSVHMLTVLALAALVALAWRSTAPMQAKAALLIPATLLCSPYAYYYEMVPMLFSIAVMISMTGIRNLNAPERWWLMLSWPLVLYLPLVQGAVPVQFGFVITASLVALIAIRLKSASAAAPAPAY